MRLPSKPETHAVTSHAPRAPQRESSPQYLAACQARQTLLKRLDEEEADDLYHALEKCGQEENLVCQCCGENWTVKKRCNRKWCPVCQRALAARASLRYEGICASMQWPLFVTWTVKNWPDDQTDFIRHLRRSFGKMRRLRWFLRAVKGGIAGIEVTNKGNGWHPHMHSVIDARWLAVSTRPPARHVNAEQFKRACTAAAREVAQQWKLCTGLPSSQKIKRAAAKGKEHADSISQEVLKYSVKGTDLVKAPGQIAPVLRMLDGTRLITSWGSCYGHLRDHDAAKIPTACGRCGTTGAWMTEKSMSTWLRSERSGYG